MSLATLPFPVASQDRASCQLSRRTLAGTHSQPHHAGQGRRPTITSILQNPTPAPEEVDQANDDVLGQGGILSEEDPTELQSTVQRRLNVSDPEAQQILEEAQQAVEEARTTLREGVQTAGEEAAQAGEEARDATSSIALWLFFGNLLAMVATVVGGRAGKVETVD